MKRARFSVTALLLIGSAVGLASGCGSAPGWNATSVADYDSALAKMEDAGALATSLIGEWSSTWSDAIQHGDRDFNGALQALRAKATTQSAIARLNATRGEADQRVRQFLQQPTTAGTRDALVTAYGHLARLCVYAVSPTGSLQGFNQATGEAENAFAASVLTARVLLPPAAAPPQK